ncbi:Zinc-binding protein A33 [Anabarilius grahami]|uniref:Zinc-binding protein A33 n=1 Tax=Anabarilius grahami TaxID=495550 RepID=A0A3N0YAP1_ANAGA|nr:Zinc-binding protein A33 [Anabarilius grahami]
MIRSIERCQTELLEMMEQKQKAAEKQKEKLILELQQELRNTELCLIIIGNPINIKKWPDINVNTPASLSTLRTALTQLQQTLDETVDFTLDPDTAHPELILSDDGKQLSHGDTKRNVPDNPKRFDHCIFVLGKEGYSSGRFYFEVQVTNKTEWNLGVARESVIRKGDITLTPQDGCWTIWLRNENEYKVLADPSSSLSVRVKPQKVGVFVDYEEGLVSFYDVESKSHIDSFTGQTFTEKLHPYFCPW